MDPFNLIKPVNKIDFPTRGNEKLSWILFIVHRRWEEEEEQFTRSLLFERRRGGYSFELETVVAAHGHVQLKR